MARSGLATAAPRLGLNRPTAWHGLLVSALAVFVYVDLALGQRTAELSIGALLAVASILAAARWPGATMGTLLVYVPLSLPLLAYLLKEGAPSALVRDLGYVKDAAVAGLCLSAVQLARKRTATQRIRIDLLDWFAIGYLAIATAYLLIPFAFPGSFGGQSFSVRINAWRLDCLFVVLLVAARRSTFSPVTIRRLRTAAYFTATVLVGFAVFEAVNKTGYNNFVVDTLGMPAYQQSVLHTAAPFNNDYVITGGLGGTIVRVGSLLLDALALGFYMVIPLALGLEQVTRSARRLLALVALVGALATLLLTQTRSAILGGLVAILLGVWLAARLRYPGRIRVVVVVVAAVLLVVPFTARSSVRARFDTLFSSTQNADNQGHQSATLAGFRTLAAHPQGLGLGANPATGLRDKTTNATVSEDSYLQVGTELGIAAMLCFVGMYLALLVKLKRTARQRRDDHGQLAGGMWLAGCGLLVTGLFLHVWISFPVALTFWGLAGIGAGHRDPVDVRSDST